MGFDRPSSRHHLRVPALVAFIRFSNQLVHLKRFAETRYCRPLLAHPSSACPGLVH